MVRLKKIYKDGTTTFSNCGHTLDAAFCFAYYRVQTVSNLKQIDIYENSKLIASVYG